MAATTSTSPNFTTDYTDERFAKLNEEYAQDVADTQNTYGNVIDSVDSFYKGLNENLEQQKEIQTKVQNDNTDFAIEQIEQQKDQANKDYKKEQSGAYVDWQKQSNQYGAEAEKMASAGLSRTGYSESSQVSMYNTYQNRVATARESYNKAVLNYNNAIKDARLQNNAALAEIALSTMQQQFELSLQGFQYKNSLVLEQANKLTELKNNRWQKELAIIQQQNTEKEMAEQYRQFNETQKWKTEQAELDRNFQAQQAEISRKFEADQAAINRQFEKDMLAAKTEKEKELLKIQQQNDLAKLKKQQEYELAQLKYQAEQNKILIDKGNTGSVPTSGALAGATAASSGNTHGGAGAKFGAYTNPKFNTPYITSYKQASSYLQSKGVPNSAAASAMTESEWSRRRNSYLSTGKGGDEVKNYSSYTLYISDYVQYCLEKYGK